LLIRRKNVINKLIKKITIYSKHFIKKALGREDRFWKFYRIDRGINSKTWKSYHDIIKWADYRLFNKEVFEKEELFYNSQDPVVVQGYHLKNEVINDFYKKYSNLNLKVLIHVPSKYISPAGYSLFTNLIQGLNFIGIKTIPLGWDDATNNILRIFEPDVFITSDNIDYISKIDWIAVSKYKKDRNLLIGLTASLEEEGNTPLDGRLQWAMDNGVDFYYCYNDEDYIKHKKEYWPYFENGYKILSVPFGANPLIYYPVPGINKDLDYVFIGTKTMNKILKYEYWKNILKDNIGFISGTGWNICGNDYDFNHEWNRYILSRSKVGLNLHVDSQIKWASQLNERTYTLAACGIPQLIDNPKILNKVFSKGCFFVGSSPEEYEELFYFILNNPDEAIRRTLKAQKEVFLKNTIFHRAEKFIMDIKQLIP